MKFFRSYTPDIAKHRLITSGCLNSEFAAWYAPDEGHDLFAEIGVPNRLHPAAVKGMRLLVVEAQPVDGVDAVELHLPALDEIRQRSDHSLAFELEFISGARGEADQGRAPVAVNHHAQLDTEPWRMPAMIFALHSLPSARRRLAMVFDDRCGRPKKYAS